MHSCITASTPVKRASSFPHTLWLCLSLLGGCATQPAILDGGALDGAASIPATFPFETFLTLTGSTYVTRSEAIVRVAGADCGEMGLLTILGEAGASADQAMEAAAHRLDAELFRSGANAYAIEGYRWIAPPTDPAASPSAISPSAIQLELSVKSLICSA